MANNAFRFYTSHIWVLAEFFLLLLIYIFSSVLGNSNCIGSIGVEYSVELFDGTSYHGLATGGCLENSNRAYNISLSIGRTVQNFVLGNETILANQLHYSYDKVRWFKYDGAILVSTNNAVGLNPPLFARYLTLSLRSSTSNRQCIKLIINVCSQTTSPSVSLVQKSTVIFSDSARLTCIVTGQPYPDVSWQTTSGFVFKSDYIVNVFSDKTGVHNSTLVLAKEKLAMDKFQCSETAPPCGTIRCIARYQGSDTSNSASVNIDIQPSPPVRVSVQIVMPHSAKITWRKQAKDAITRYSSFRFVLTSIIGPPTILFVPVNNNSLYAFSYQITNLRSCIFYLIEVTNNNYFGESIGVRTNFTTPAGVIAVALNAPFVNATSIMLNWQTETVTGNCDVLQVRSFEISYRCLSGYSNLTTCNSPIKAQIQSRDSRAAISKLNPFTSYSVKLIALTTRVGVNITSNNLLITTKEAVPAGKPSNIVMHVHNSSSLTIQWGPIPVNGRHGLIHNYVLTILNSVTSRAVRNYTSANATTSVVATDLEVCTEYTVTVKGCTSVGCGPSSSNNVRTLDRSIDSPHSVNITIDDMKPNNVTMVVSLQKSNFSRCVIGFAIQYRALNTDAWSVPHRMQLNQTGYITGFKPLTMYEFRSRFFGYSSISNWSKTIRVKTHEGIPSTVRYLRISSHYNQSISISWEVPLQSHGVILSYEISVHGTRNYNDIYNYKKKLQVPGNATSYEIHSIPPGTTFIISISARNTRHVGIAKEISFISDAIQQRRPAMLVIDRRTSFSNIVRFTFGGVSDLNGPASKFQVIVLRKLSASNTLPDNFTSELHNFTVAESMGLNYYFALEISHFNQRVFFKIGDGSITDGRLNAPLNRSLGYTVYVRAVSIWNGKTLYSPLSSADVAGFVANFTPSVEYEVGKDGRKMQSFKVSLPIFHPQVQFIHVVIQKVDVALPTKPQHPNHLGYLNLTRYSDSKKDGFSKPYITAELGRAFFQQHTKFTVGTNQLTSREDFRRRRNTEMTKILNGPLEPGSFYYVFIRAYQSYDVYYSSDWSSLIMTSQPSTTSAKPKESVSGLIAGVVICLLAVPLIILFIVLLWRSKKTTITTSHRFSNMELMANGRWYIGSENPYFHDEVFLPGTSNASGQGYDLSSHYPTDPSHPPVAISDFADHVSNMRERDYTFEDEFEELTSAVCRGKIIAEKEANRHKNRDETSVTFDHSRVILYSKRKGCTDYINASFIDSYKTRSAYIATQAPLVDCIGDFWDLVWQQNVHTIVMINHYLDTGKATNPCYWPTPGSKHTHCGDFSVKCEDTIADDHFYIRDLSLIIKHSTPRRIRHFQYTGWPEASAPKATNDLLAFRDQVNQWHQDQLGPILVHCSNGSGRTGTYIALDAILNNIEQSREIDIFNYVSYLRSRRTKMVENDDQYEFIHDAVLDVLTKVDQHVEMSRMNANSVVVGLGKVDPLTGYNGYTRIFKHLNHGIPSISSISDQEGSKAINEYKNRYIYKVPNDNFRVRLPIKGNSKSNVSDYINATFVTMSDESRFITTQAPFGITVNDFWSMVYFSRAEAIVMLNDLQEDSVTFPAYWPNADTLTATYGHFKVSLELESTPFPCVIRRDFTFSELGNANVTREVTQFHMLGWEDHDVPSSKNAMLKLTKYLAEEYMMREKAPIIAQCSDGYGRSGTFCTCLYVAKELSATGTINVPKIVRKFRERHRSYVENEAQFRFIFEFTRDFLENYRKNARI